MKSLQIAHELEKLTNEYKISSHDIDNYKVNWLIEQFIQEHSLINFYAAPGNGKSLGVLHLAIDLLRKNKIRRVYYFDNDNGMATLKNRHIGDLEKEFHGRFLYYGFAAKKYTGKLEQSPTNNLFLNINRFAKANLLKDDLIIIDSFRDFISCNMNYDHEVSPYLKLLANLREYTKGIWFLHHQNKQSLRDREENNKSYKGATSFIDTPDEAYFVQKRSSIKDKEVILTFEPMKQREPTEAQAVRIDLQTHLIEFLDYRKNSLSRKEKHSMELVEQVLQGDACLNLKTLVERVKRLAKEEMIEIVGVNNLKYLIKLFAGGSYKCIKDKKSKNGLLFISNSYQIEDVSDQDSE